MSWGLGPQHLFPVGGLGEPLTLRESGTKVTGGVLCYQSSYHSPIFLLIDFLIHITTPLRTRVIIPMFQMETLSLREVK